MLTDGGTTTSLHFERSSDVEAGRLIDIKGSARVQRVTQAANEHLRRSYRPDPVRLLFVGEAPPASGRFFYRGDSGLYRAIRDTFVRVFPAIRNDNFLESFRLLGCYLVDLCGTSVDQLSSRHRKKVCLGAETRLGRVIKEMSPRILITVVRSISPNVRRARRRANWKGSYFELPYPGRWKHHRVEFARELGAILQREIGGALIPQTL